MNSEELKSCRMLIICVAASIWAVIYSVYSYNCREGSNKVEIERIRLQQILAEHRTPADSDNDRIKIDHEFRTKQIEMFSSTIHWNLSSDNAKDAIMKLIEHNPGIDNEIIKLSKK